MLLSPVLKDPQKYSHHLCAFSKETLELSQAVAFCSDPEFGAVSFFIGKVRRTNVGKSVVSIDYESFESLGVHILKKICAEAEELCKYPLKICVLHRVGKLMVSDTSVIVAVGCVHRDEACTANRYIIEELKHRAPIWKLEQYVDGDSGWVKGHSLCQHRKPSAYFQNEQEAIL